MRGARGTSAPSPPPSSEPPRGTSATWPPPSSARSTSSESSAGEGSAAAHEEEKSAAALPSWVQQGAHAAKEPVWNNVDRERGSVLGPLVDANGVLSACSCFKMHIDRSYPSTAP